MRLSGGRAFQAKGTEYAKAMRQRFVERQQGGLCGWSGGSERESVREEGQRGSPGPNHGGPHRPGKGQCEGNPLEGLKQQKAFNLSFF